jgi:hypothetical protein
LEPGNSCCSTLILILPVDPMDISTSAHGLASPRLECKNFKLRKKPRSSRRNSSYAGHTWVYFVPYLYVHTCPIISQKILSSARPIGFRFRQRLRLLVLSWVATIERKFHSFPSRSLGLRGDILEASKWIYFRHRWTDSLASVVHTRKLANLADI